MKPCEYCGQDLPEGVDKKTRQIRSYHFSSCPARLKKVEEDVRESARIESAFEQAEIESLRQQLEEFVPYTHYKALEQQLAEAKSGTADQLGADKTGEGS